MATDSRHSEDSLLATLRRAAAESPNQEWSRLGGSSIRVADALASTEKVARGFLELGMQPGDRVAVMAGNIPEMLWTWLGTNAAGLIDVPLNTDARGRLLAYFVGDAEPRVLVGTEEYLQLLAGAVDADPEIVVVIGPCSGPPFGDRARHVEFSELESLREHSDVELEPPAARDTATILYTSGTTGPSKGVMLPQGYYPAQGMFGADLTKVGPSDVIYHVAPLFHIESRLWLNTTLRTGATIALGKRFSLSRFWDEVREHEATIMGFIGSIMWLLWKQPRTLNDTNHPARVAMGSAMAADWHREFEERFGLEIYDSWGMTETGYGTGPILGESSPGRVGKVCWWYEWMIAGDNDDALAPGAVGELLLRPKVPFSFMQGYWRKPEATVEAWRNLWFHTGDLMREHPDGQLEFLGRKKDSIRRRGENVSAWEVEQAINRHSQVADVAAIGVPSDVGEEDVAVFCVLVPDSPLTPEELIQFVEADLPRFAVPRYVEFVDKLPKTASERTAKGELRERGLSDWAWDANIALGRR